MTVSGYPEIGFTIRGLAVYCVLALTELRGIGASPWKTPPLLFSFFLHQVIKELDKIQDQGSSFGLGCVEERQAGSAWKLCPQLELLRESKTKKKWDKNLTCALWAWCEESIPDRFNEIWTAASHWWCLLQLTSNQEAAVVIKRLQEVKGWSGPQLPPPPKIKTQTGSESY